MRVSRVVANKIKREGAGGRQRYRTVELYGWRANEQIKMNRILHYTVHDAVLSPIPSLLAAPIPVVH